MTAWVLHNWLQNSTYNIWVQSPEASLRVRPRLTRWDHEGPAGADQGYPTKGQGCSRLTRTQATWDKPRGQGPGPGLPARDSLTPGSACDLSDEVRARADSGGPLARPPAGLVIRRLGPGPGQGPGHEKAEAVQKHHERLTDDCFLYFLLC